jgi:hypothetical protein
MCGGVLTGKTGMVRGNSRTGGEKRGLQPFRTLFYNGIHSPIVYTVALFLRSRLRPLDSMSRISRATDEAKTAYEKRLPDDCQEASLKKEERPYD